MYIDISQLREFDSSESEKVTNRWHSGNGFECFKHIEKLIKDGAGEDFLTYDFQEGILKNFLDDEWDLRGIRLHSIDLNYPSGDTFQGINFSYGKFKNCVFKGCMFDASFYFVRFVNCQFIDCIFANSFFKGCYFEDCKFDEIDFFAGERISNCVIANTEFLDFFSPHNLFTDCKITDSSFFQKPLSKPNKIGNELFEDKSLSNFYNQLNLGSKESGAFKKASDYRYKSEKAHTRFNSKSFFEKWKRILIDELIIGYGERPSRTLFTSVFVIVLFASFYLLQGFSIDEANTGFTETINYTINFADFGDNIFSIEYYWKLGSDLLDAIYFSFSAFVIFGIDNITSSNQLSRFLLVIEAFLGTTLIGAWTALLLKKITPQ